MGLCLSLSSPAWFKIASYKVNGPTEQIENFIISSSNFGILNPGMAIGSTMDRDCSDHGLEDACIKSSRNNMALTQIPTKSQFDAAALKLQKVYKSYRTRRNLADCAVVAEELWWKALDFASLEHSSVSFFNNSKKETAVSRWARARTRAAKVGKGLSKSNKAQKLALRHWLEAIDPRHRYGHNLHLYYDVWVESESTQPFFYWLDIGDGKEVNLEKCPRSKLQQQCIKYLGPNERQHYEVVIENGRLVYKLSKMFVNTDEGSKWIFVLSTSRALYVGEKLKGTFQHSSFLAGGATIAAGRLVVEEGNVEAVWRHSGHYRPTVDNFKEFIKFLEEKNVDLSDVKRYSVDDEDGSPSPSSGKAREESLMADTKAIESVEDLSNTDGAELSGDEEDEHSHVLNLEVNHKPTIDLARKRSCKWTTGAGPRIGCVRDYPTDLQCKALEQLNLSPRVMPSPLNKTPIPSPRPSPKVRLSPAITYNTGNTRPTISLTLPQHRR